MFAFSEVSQIVLRSAGWEPQRSVDPTLWLDFLQQEGYCVFEAAVTILEHLGGLDLKEYIPALVPASLAAGTPVVLADNTQILFDDYPTFDFIPNSTPDSDYDMAAFWTTNSLLKKQGLEIFPIGSLNYMTTWFVLSDGRIFKSEFYAPEGYNYDHENEPANLIYLGKTIAEAVNTLVQRCIVYL